MKEMANSLPLINMKPVHKDGVLNNSITLFFCPENTQLKVVMPYFFDACHIFLDDKREFGSLKHTYIASLRL